MADVEKVMEFLEDDKNYLFKMADNPNYSNADRRKADDLYLDIKEAIQTIRELKDRNDEYEEQLESYGETIDELNVHLTDSIEKIAELQEQIPKWHFVADGDMPKEQNDILLLLRSGEISTGMLAYTDGYFYTDCISTKYVDIENVIAWTELPKFESEE